MMGPRLQRLAYAVGTLLCVLSIGFVGRELVTQAQAIDLARYGWGFWVFFAGLTLAYALAGFLLARGWFYLMALVRVPVRWCWAARVYGQAQIAKYAPGNVFHLAGRQAMGMGAGLPAGPLARTTVLELAGQGVVALVACLLALPLLWPALPVSLAAAMALMLGGVTLWSAVRLKGVLLAWALLAQLGFLMVAAATFVALLEWVTPSPLELALWPALAGAFCVAWVLGFVTPGAPGGVGVRELVLVLLLQPVAVRTDVVVAVVLGRLLSVAGDALLLLLAACLPRTPPTFVEDKP